MAKGEVRSNITQNDSKWSSIAYIIHILVQSGQKGDWNLKMAKSQASSNIILNDSKWSL